MHLIIIAVVVVSVIGLISGLGLAVASKVMAVPVDEKAEEIQAALPGANCGACGFSGCSGYAAALSEGKTTDTGTDNYTNAVRIFFCHIKSCHIKSFS